MVFSAQSETIKISVSTTASTPVLLPRIGNCIQIISGPTQLSVGWNFPDVITIAISQDQRLAEGGSAVPSNYATPIVYKSKTILRLPSHEGLYISTMCDDGEAELYVSVGEDG